MKKIIALLGALIISFIFIKDVYAPQKTQELEISIKIYKEFKEYVEIQRYKNEFNRFLYDLGMAESNNNWKVYNKYGYIGQFQLGKEALKDVGYGHIKFKEFIKNPSIFPQKDQKDAVTKLIKKNSERLDKYFIKYIGKNIKGIPITKSGILAAAHLGGTGGVKLFLDTNGNVNKKDAFNTSIASYLSRFKNYKI